MPRGVYDRSKMNRTKDSAKRFTLTIEGDTAQQWAKIERQLNEQYPFKITRMQILSLLLATFEEQSKKVVKNKGIGTTTGGWAS